MTKICLILVYFGPWPSYFELFKRSVASNPTVDFLVVTDNSEDQTTDPANFRRVLMTMDEFATLASEKLEFPVLLEAAYKICDLKPMFGHLFDERLSAYEFWGHCDCDLVFGNLRNFLTENLFDRYSKVLINGALSLYRNDALGRGLYSLGVGETDWRAALSRPDVTQFDEWNGIFKICQSRGIEYFYDRDISGDISPHYYGLTTDRFQKAWPQVYYWQAGSIYRTDGNETQEFAYIHLMKRKPVRPSPDTLTSERVYFTPTGFMAADSSPISIDKMKTINPLRAPYSGGGLRSPLASFLKRLPSH